MLFLHKMLEGLLFSPCPTAWSLFGANSECEPVSVHAQCKPCLGRVIIFSMHACFGQRQFSTV